MRHKTKDWFLNVLGSLTRKWGNLFFTFDLLDTILIFTSGQAVILAFGRLGFHTKAADEPKCGSRTGRGLEGVH